MPHSGLLSARMATRSTRCRAEEEEKRGHAAGHGFDLIVGDGRLARRG